MSTRLAMLCAVLAVGASCMPSAHAQGSAQKDAAAARAFCLSPAFRKLSCAYNGLMGADEAKATTANSCPLCGTVFAALPEPSTLPKVVTGHISYDQYASSLVSLACKGDAVVRSVFKYTKFDDSAAPAGGGKECAYASLAPGTPDAKSTPIVRCQLELPAGPEPEAVRATRAKEGRCWKCDACSDGGGCPAAKGQWYSDFSKGYSPVLAGIHVNPNTAFLLAKFEICNSASCFNPAAEAAKRKAAKRCVNGVC